VAHEYLVPAWLPCGDDPETLGRALGMPLAAGPDDWEAADADDLMVLAVPAEPGAADFTRRVFGFGINLTLGFIHLGPSVPEAGLRRATGGMLRALASLRSALGEEARAVVLEEHADDSLLLRLDERGFTLNRSWAGWSRWPELVDAVPGPPRYEALRLLA
jgi:hypothetical protein